jgi:hypothetical protein
MYPRVAQLDIKLPLTVFGYEGKADELGRRLAKAGVFGIKK